MDNIKTQLRNMGFNEAKIDRALTSCPEAQTLEQVMEWLISHEDELNSETSTDAPNNGEQVNHSDEKGTALNNANQTETEGDDNKAKKITVEEAQRLIQERQSKRAEEERKKAIENEKKRRVEGQKMSEVRSELQNQEMLNMAAAIRKEKLEKELHKKKVLEQIARDRENMRLRSNPVPLVEKLNSLESSASSSSTTTKGREPSNECKIALRFADGSNLIHKFSPKEQLSAVRLFVQMEKKTDRLMEFVAPPNKKLGETNMHETLDNLGLCPASRLEVRYSQPMEDLD